MEKTIKEYVRQINNKVQVLGYNKQEVEVVGKILRELAEGVREECKKKCRDLMAYHHIADGKCDGKCHQLDINEIESIEIK